MDICLDAFDAGLGGAEVGVVRVFGRAIPSASPLRNPARKNGDRDFVGCVTAGLCERREWLGLSADAGRLR